MTLAVGSLFAGVGGFEAAFESVRMKVKWSVEIDKNCRHVLRRHFPGVKLYDDIRTVGASNLEPVDLVCGGFPCQDLSVAGKRAGLSGERSGLFFEMARVVYELRPKYLVWENVPGLLSSCSCQKCRRHCERCGATVGADDEVCDVCGSDELRGRVLQRHRGADFFAVVSTLGQIGYDGAWRILDAQHFGVAQRRRRLFGVFVNRGLGNMGGLEPETSYQDARRVAGLYQRLLLERESVPGDTPPRRQAGKEFTATAGTLTSNRGGLDRPAGNANELDFCVPTGFDESTTVASTLGGGDGVHRGYRNDLDGSGAYIPVVANALAFATTQNHYDPSQQKYIPTTADGVARSITSRNTRLSSDQENFVVEPVSPIAPAVNYASTRCDGDRGALAVAFQLTGDRDNPNVSVYDNVMPTLPANPMSDRQVAVVHTEPTPLYYTHDYNQDRIYDCAGVSPAHCASDNNRTRNFLTPTGVRRLTPTECERLQGFEDGWTEWGIDEDGNRVSMSDGTRYRMMGNAVCKYVPEFIGRNIVREEQCS